MLKRILLLTVVLLLLGVTLAAYLTLRPDYLDIERGDSTLGLTLEPVVSGLSQPLFVNHAGDGSGRLFVVERDGIIRILEDGALLPEPFLNIDEQVKSDDGEQGLFTLAFHPDYATNGRFFVNYTREDDGRVVVSEFRVSDDPNRADSAEKIIIEVEQPATTHNGGQVSFGPEDGFLYVSLGDGHWPSEQGLQPLQLSSLLGKMLRLDVDSAEPYAIPRDNPFVDSDTARPEVWAYGFRNPWRFSFHPSTGDLWLADVGGVLYEEVNIVHKGANYGWPLFEGPQLKLKGSIRQVLQGKLVGFVQTVGAQVLSGGEAVQSPIGYYRHLEVDEQGGNAITGGYVYRGKIPELQGRYVFGDFVSGRIWSLEQQDGSAQMEMLVDTSVPLVSFGEDEQGELYAVSVAGEVLQFATP